MASWSTRRVVCLPPHDILTSGLLLAALVCLAMASSIADPFTKTELVHGSNKFAIELYNALKGDGNVFIAPLSITSCLGLLYMMSEGPTAEELTQVMHFNSSDYVKVTEAYRQALKSLDKDTLSWANSVFVDHKLPIKKAYTDAVKSFMGAKSENLDLDQEIEKSRQYINRWVASETHEMIKELLPKSFSEDKNKAMVLVSAVYFKNEWIKPFDYTYKMEFHGTNGTKYLVDAMHTTGDHFGLAQIKEIGSNVVRIDYKGKCQSLLLFLPIEDGFALDKVEESLKSVDFVHGVLDKVPHGRKNNEFQVLMPKFKLELNYELSRPLKKLGLSRVFSSRIADFSKATDLKTLQVSNVFHSAAIEVDEKGTVAAGATGTEISFDSLPMSFSFDRPFMFAIVDNPTSSIVFMGRYTQPPNV